MELYRRKPPAEIAKARENAYFFLSAANLVGEMILRKYPEQKELVELLLHEMKRYRGSEDDYPVTCPILIEIVARSEWCKGTGVWPVETATNILTPQSHSRPRSKMVPWWVHEGYERDPRKWHEVDGAMVPPEWD